MDKYTLSRERKNQIKDVVLAALEKADIHSLPVDISAIFHAYNISHIFADSCMERTAPDKGDDWDGCVIKSANRFLVVTNTSMPVPRRRYSAAVFLSYILLKNVESDLPREVTDAEAAYFADELLMPLSVLDSYGCESEEDIMERCNVSFTAAKIRLHDFERRNRYKKENGETEYDIRFLNQFFGGKR